MTLAVLILPAALLCLVSPFLGREGWRDGALRACVLFGAAVALLTETLGALVALRRWPLLLAWCAVCLAAVIRRSKQRPPIARPGLLDAALVAGIAAVAVVIGATAWLSPPNSADAMAYHLPRVLYWAQAATVDFFPTSYYNQIMLPPLAEYFMLHTWVLSGGDRAVNFVQFFGFLGSVIGTSLIAQALGAARRGQICAALVCATIPNGILQASGAKNDYLLALWLAAMVYFALRREMGWTGLALSLALLTKGTAYLFAPPLLAAAFAPAPRALLRALPVLILAVLGLNGPQYARNFALSGSPLGFDSAHADGRFRWRNDRLGLRPTASNVLRNLAAHLGARSPLWNQRVYDAVVRLHAAIGVDANDPATTWPGDRFGPPVNSNHEADSPNRWHLLLLLAAVFGLARARPGVALYAGLAAAFLLFCFYLKWMPWITRLHLPLFVLGSPLIGCLIVRLLPAPAQAALCLFLLNNARPYLFENWTRPLTGPSSLLHNSRRDNYFRDTVQWSNRSSYERAVGLTLASGCTSIGIDISRYELEYPYQALLREANPDIRFAHTGVTNASARYRRRPSLSPCAVLCFDCAESEEHRARYIALGEPVAIGHFLLFPSPPSAAQRPR